MTTITYEKKNNSFIVYCNWDDYEDFFTPLNSIRGTVEGKKCFIIPLDKERELIKILNYLNATRTIYGSSTKEERKEEREEEVEDEVSDKISFFKSFGRSDFRKTLKKDEDEEEYDEEEYHSEKKSEYSSSSYDESSSDNFPSPRTPKKKSNYSNEQLYFMIEKIQRKISLIERILEKKFLKS